MKPITLQQLMRHDNVETTMKYYAAQDAGEIAEELHREFGMGATLGAIGENEAPHSEEVHSVKSQKALRDQGL